MTRTDAGIDAYLACSLFEDPDSLPGGRILTTAYWSVEQEYCNQVRDFLRRRRGLTGKS